MTGRSLVGSWAFASQNGNIGESWWRRGAPGFAAIVEARLVPMACRKGSLDHTAVRSIIPSTAALPRLSVERVAFEQP
jgi:hypothetical protein